MIRFVAFVIAMVFMVAALAAAVMMYYAAVRLELPPKAAVTSIDGVRRQWCTQEKPVQLRDGRWGLEVAYDREELKNFSVPGDGYMSYETKNLISAALRDALVNDRGRKTSATVRYSMAEKPSESVVLVACHHATDYTATVRHTDERGRVKHYTITFTTVDAVDILGTKDLAPPVPAPEEVRSKTKLRLDEIRRASRLRLAGFPEEYERQLRLGKGR